MALVNLADTCSFQFPFHLVTLPLRSQPTKVLRVMAAYHPGRWMATEIHDGVKTAAHTLGVLLIRFGSLI